MFFRNAMELTETQEILLSLLGRAGYPEDFIIGVMLMLYKSEKAMQSMCLYIEDNKPTKSQILEKGLDLCREMPPEELTGVFIKKG